MNRAERIYRLHRLLSGRMPVSMDRLMESLHASRATVKRDLAYFRDFFRAPVIYDREANGYHYDPDEEAFELPGLFFNESELFALLASERILESVQPGVLAPKLGPLKARVRKLLEESGHTADTVAERIVVRHFAPRRSDSDTFGQVAAAVLEGRQLDLTYHGRRRDRQTQRRVHCSRLVHYRANWYLLAWCERAGALRLFSLERILGAEPTTLPVSQPDANSDLDRFVNASFGIFSGEADQWARIRFSAEMARWVAEETWHSDQIGYWADDGRYELQLPYSRPDELLMEILRYGADAEILAPEMLRTAAHERLRDALAQYDDQNGPTGS
jgi:predicted DNA-binding transcriptional regulator YafY